MYFSYLQEVIASVQAGLTLLSATDRDNFETTIDLIVKCRKRGGRVLFSGVGKSGHIARKIASTMTSLGVPTQFFHAAEASHGDMGVVQNDDLVFIISHSGETTELTDLLFYCQNHEVTTVGISSREESTLARQTTHNLIYPRVPEACVHGLAPTTSTTLALVLGDALAVAASAAMEFQPEDFYRYHPGGKLGKRFIKVNDLMHTGTMIPIVSQDATIFDAAIEISEKRMGCTAVIAENKLVGMFTDGDLRRAFKNKEHEQPITNYFSKNPIICRPSDYALDALAKMNCHEITVLFVIENETLVGIIHMHDLVRAGISTV